ncbi:cyanoglobin [Halarchaeum acidiphilum MH1-52-1]|uniref:Cyanoglobin n=1 Tax=Halarchaeum acidiphilum MH1-52-1 TaxID=1261545 RepID=U3A5L9_9EURY|nr:group 1 truncated hemoglobin [Halarchaeum acidiphilum]GAD52939.1 cyanoglobin [Halarchaeum acidiphilum MH1-52-1]
MPTNTYDAIGGREAVEAVVSDFYDRVFDDDDLEHYFADTDPEALFAHQVRFISAVAGGPVEYDGRDMREAHDHLGIAPADFDTVADYLEAALRENGVDEPHVETILGAVADLKDPIVGR